MNPVPLDIDRVHVYMLQTMINSFQCCDQKNNQEVILQNFLDYILIHQPTRILSDKEFRKILLMKCNEFYRDKMSIDTLHMIYKVEKLLEQLNNNQVITL